jgi:hypothetical protein
MLEIILILMSVQIAKRYREAGEPGGGNKFIIAVWVILGVGISILSLVALLENMDGNLNLEDFLMIGGGLFLTYGYLPAFIVAGVGMRKGRKKLEAKLESDQYEADHQRHTQLQQQLREAEIAAQKSQISDVERLKNLKNLLDSGAITQEEFNAKKAEILAEK